MFAKQTIKIEIRD